MDEDIEWSVEQILQRGRIDSVTHYLVKWKGYPRDEATWQPIMNLQNCQEQIKKYESSIPAHKPKTTRRNRTSRLEMERIFNNNLELPQPLDRSPNEEISPSIKFDQKQNVFKKEQPAVEIKQSRIMNKNNQHFKEISPRHDSPSNQENNQKLQCFDFVDSNTKSQAYNSQNQKMQLWSSRKNKRPRPKISFDVYEHLESKPRKRMKLPAYQSTQSPTQDLVKKQCLGDKYIQEVLNQDAGTSEQKNRSFILYGSKKQQNQKEISQIENIPQIAEIVKYSGSNLQTIKANPISDTIEDQQQEIAQTDRPTSKQLKKDSNLQAEEVLIFQSSLFFQHLFNNRQILCDKFFKEQQSLNFLKALNLQDSPQQQVKLTIIDLYDSPDILEKAAPLSIFSDPDQDLEEPKALVRLRTGWRAIGRIGQRLAIVSVQCLTEQSWLQICEKLEQKT